MPDQPRDRADGRNDSEARVLRPPVRTAHRRHRPSSPPPSPPPTPLGVRCHPPRICPLWLAEDGLEVGGAGFIIRRPILPCTAAYSAVLTSRASSPRGVDARYPRGSTAGVGGWGGGSPQSSLWYVARPPLTPPPTPPLPPTHPLSPTLEAAAPPSSQPPLNPQPPSPSEPNPTPPTPLALRVVLAQVGAPAAA